MKILFATSNPGKFDQVKRALEGVEVEQLAVELREMQSLDQLEVVRDKAIQAVGIAKRPVVVEDTSLYFENFPLFPGTFTKYLYQSLGFKGMFKLLEGTNRKAFFKTIAAYTEPGKDPVFFEGVLNGRISETFKKPKTEHLPFIYVFIPEGFDIPYAEIPEGKCVTHREKAFLKLKEYLSVKK